MTWQHTFRSTQGRPEITLENIFFPFEKNRKRKRSNCYQTGRRSLKRVTSATGYRWSTLIIKQMMEWSCALSVISDDYVKTLWTGQLLGSFLLDLVCKGRVQEESTPLLTHFSEIKTRSTSSETCMRDCMIMNPSTEEEQNPVDTSDTWWSQLGNSAQFPHNIHKGNDQNSPNNSMIFCSFV